VQHTAVCPHLTWLHLQWNFLQIRSTVELLVCQLQCNVYFRVLNWSIKKQYSSSLLSIFLLPGYVKKWLSGIQNCTLIVNSALLNDMPLIFFYSFHCFGFYAFPFLHSRRNFCSFNWVSACQTLISFHLSPVFTQSAIWSFHQQIQCASTPFPTRFHWGQNGGFSYVEEEKEKHCVAKVRLATFVWCRHVIAFVSFLNRHQMLNSYYLPCGW
jgi:hypothetical protein